MDKDDEGWTYGDSGVLSGVGSAKNIGAEFAEGRRPPEAPPYVCPAKPPKMGLKSAII
jgi:hypothetical protein